MLAPSAVASPGTSGTGPVDAPGAHYSDQAPALRGSDRAKSFAKAQTAMAFFQKAQQAWAHPGAGPDVICEGCGTAGPPSNRTLAVALQHQVNGIYCGPTSMAMIVQFKGHGFPGSPRDQQNAAAGMLYTRQHNGTNYGDMRPALNARIGTSFYYNMPLPDYPSSSQISYFQAQLVYDVNDGSGWPLAANEDATPQYWLEHQTYYDSQGRPATIQHWIVPTGYANGGSVTYFQDPAWGQAIGPSHNSTAYFVTALGGRGYVF